MIERCLYCFGPTYVLSVLAGCLMDVITGSRVDYPENFAIGAFGLVCAIAIVGMSPKDVV